MKIKVGKKNVSRLLELLLEENEGLERVVKYYEGYAKMERAENDKLTQHLAEAEYALMLNAGEIEALQVELKIKESAVKILTEENTKLVNDLEW